MATASPHCKTCQKPLNLQQTCLNVFWHCLNCGKNYFIEEYPEFIDDTMAERLANVRCNRI
jgi:ribosomal protein L37AE/L43A